MTLRVRSDQMLDHRPVARRKRDAGAMAHFSGCAAEESVARAYADLGCELLASRWRGQSGEIDLIFSEARALVFVEVKKARSFDAAAHRLSVAQARRIHSAAEEYLAQTSSDPLTEMRFDLALCNQAGEIEIREGAFSYF